MLRFKTDKHTNNSLEFKETSRNKKIIKLSLKQTLKIAKSIEENNAGKPYERIKLCKSLNLSPNEPRFTISLAASTRYGLTTGNSNADKIELTKLGSSVVSPMGNDDYSQAIKQVLIVS